MLKIFTLHVNIIKYYQISFNTYISCCIFSIMSNRFVNFRIKIHDKYILVNKLTLTKGDKICWGIGSDSFMRY